MQAHSSTAQMNEQLLAASQPPQQPTNSSYTTFKLWAHYGYNLSNTFIKTGFSSALLISDSFGGEEVFGGMTAPGIAIGIALGIAFSICEADAHNAEGKHFIRANDKSSSVHDIENQALPAPVSTPEKTISTGKYIRAGVHLLSDVVGGVEPCIFFAKKALGIDTIAPWQRGLSYAGMGIYSLIGNLIEWDNTITAFKEEGDDDIHEHHHGARPA
jgi:hypothetical protein